MGYAEMGEPEAHDFITFVDRPACARFTRQIDLPGKSEGVPRKEMFIRENRNRRLPGSSLWIAATLLAISKTNA
jgi:hypothetical protein